MPKQQHKSSRHRTTISSTSSTMSLTRSLIKVSSPESDSESDPLTAGVDPLTLICSDCKSARPMSAQLQEDLRDAMAQSECMHPERTAFSIHDGGWARDRHLQSRQRPPARLHSSATKRCASLLYKTGVGIAVCGLQQ